MVAGSVAGSGGLLGHKSTVLRVVLRQVFSGLAAPLPCPTGKRKIFSLSNPPETADSRPEFCFGLAPFPLPLPATCTPILSFLWHITIQLPAQRLFNMPKNESKTVTVNVEEFTRTRDSVSLSLSVSKLSGAPARAFVNNKPAGAHPCRHRHYSLLKLHTPFSSWSPAIYSSKRDKSNYGGPAHINFRVFVLYFRATAPPRFPHLGAFVPLTLVARLHSTINRFNFCDSHGLALPSVTTSNTHIGSCQHRAITVRCL